MKRGEQEQRERSRVDARVTPRAMKYKFTEVELQGMVVS